MERVGADDEDVLLVTVAPSERRPLPAILEAWLRVRAREAVEAAIARHAGPLGVTPAAVTVRDTRSRWGSASRQGRLMLAWRLVLAPPAVLETVVVHELAHLRVFGHGPALLGPGRDAGPGPRGPPALAADACRGAPRGARHGLTGYDTNRGRSGGSGSRATTPPGSGAATGSRAPFRCR